MSIESQEDISALQQVGALVSKTIKLLIENIRPGVTTKELDDKARAYFESFGARSAPELAYRFPGATCISVNQEAAHGIPGPRIIRPGDLVNVDVSLELNGYYADAGYSVCVDPVSPIIRRLCLASQNILLKTVKSLRAGNKINKIGRTIENSASNLGYSVIRNLAGHGTGRKLHEEPFDIVNYRDPSDSRLLRSGMVIAVETFISTGPEYVAQARDGWTLTVPADSYVAQFEHTLIVTNREPLLLTA